MLFCIRLPNFVKIGAPVADIWRYTHFSRWRPLPLYTTSGFVFVNVAAFRSSKSISKPNFVQISQLAAEIWLLPLSKYKRPPYWNSTSGFDIHHFAVIILHLTAEFRPNRSTHCGNMTSYLFLKMAAATAKYIDVGAGLLLSKTCQLFLHLSHLITTHFQAFFGLIVE